MFISQPTIKVTNKEFIDAIFGVDAPFCHVTDFPYDPGAIPSDKHLIAWKGDYFSSYQFGDYTNQYFTISTFYADDQGTARRRKALYRQTHCVVLDDVKEKLDAEVAKLLPTPSWILETSEGSEQWGYILTEPCTVAAHIDNLNDGLIESDLAPSGKDPGQRGVTRYVRLPEGVNNKTSKLVDGKPFKCRMLSWQPFNTVTLEQLAEPFNIDLDRPRRGSRVDGAAVIDDHPLIVSTGDSLHIKGVISGGRYSCTCPWVDEHTGAVDNGSAIFTNEDGSIGFKCHHGACQDRTGVDLLKWLEEQKPGFKQHLKQWQTTRSFNTLPIVPKVVEAGAFMSQLRSFSSKGRSREMKMKMLDDEFVFKDIAILGQWTVLYAGPGTGKTLLALWLLREAIQEGRIKPAKVFYANCDDNYRGGVEKLELAEELGFEMLLPNEQGFNANALMAVLQGIAKEGNASGAIIILDTLKKFTDLMSKQESSLFGLSAREFIAAGGTLICLAHVSKHKNAEGKSVYAGTSDIRDDADCTYTIEHLGVDPSLSGDLHTVVFENTKARGDVKREEAFRYLKKDKAGYRHLLDSVERLSDNLSQRAKEDAADREYRQEHGELIRSITDAILTGAQSKGDIEKAVGHSRRKVGTVLEKYSGRMWSVAVGAHNKSIYCIIEAPEPPIEAVSFL